MPGSGDEEPHVGSVCVWRGHRKYSSRGETHGSKPCFGKPVLAAVKSAG